MEPWPTASPPPPPPPPVQNLGAEFEAGVEHDLDESEDNSRGGGGISLEIPGYQTLAETYERYVQRAAQAVDRIEEEEAELRTHGTGSQIHQFKCILCWMGTVEKVRPPPVRRLCTRSRTV